MKKILFVVVLAVSVSASAQEFNVPVGYKLKTNEDYKPYETTIVNCIKWLQSTPVNKDVSKRKDAVHFLSAWVVGCPYIGVTVDASVIKFANVNQELLIIYMGGWVLDAIESGTDGKDVVKGTMAGLKSVIAY